MAGDDFRPVAFAAAAPRFALAGRRPSFDIDLAAVADEPADDAADWLPQARGRGKPLGLKTGLELRVCKPRAPGASLNPG